MCTLISPTSLAIGVALSGPIGITYADDTTTEN